MWDVYRNHQEPQHYLILKADAAFPVNLNRAEWGLIAQGHGTVAKDIAEDVVRNGYVILNSTLPYEKTATLGEPR
ncbi:hypothetical protein ACQR18_17530 [Bradyrhizobium oligotrophicum]|uniref:hypothetical protein n=1 Tax=Bradyrhizobium oligotrophicum TaxID=44255 RepID=UPI003EBCD654